MKKYTYRGIIAVYIESQDISKNKRAAAKPWCKWIKGLIFVTIFIILIKSLEKVEIHFIHTMFQQEELSLNSKIYFVITVIVFSSITTCGSEILKVRVGEKAQLDFPYPCDSTAVTLQHANARPFYRSANPHYMSVPSNQNLVNYNETGLDQCFLNLTINPVSRANEGIYIFTAYKNGVMLPDYPRIYLGVDYPPGKASCKISNDHNDGEWVSLQCIASLGTLPGHIVCYQNDMRLPPKNKLRESGRNLNQIILARLDGVVYCCSSILTETKDKCNCTDWGWDPISDSVSDIADPCTEVMSTENPTSTHSITIDNNNSSPSNLVTAPTKYPENHKNSSYSSVTCTLITVISILVIIIVSLVCTCTCKYRCKAKELARLQSTCSITPETKAPFLPVNEEVAV